jgi:hypothetical protein
VFCWGCVVDSAAAFSVAALVVVATFVAAAVAFFSAVLETAAATASVTGAVLVCDCWQNWWDQRLVELTAQKVAFSKQ